MLGIYQESMVSIVAEAKEVRDLGIPAVLLLGEYSMIKGAALRGWIDEQRVVLDTMTSFKL
jgi:porphobilinogen synthase